jgi:multiple sugar transport system permease protein
MGVSRRRHEVRVRIGVSFGLLLGACFAVLPILWMVLSSFKPNSRIFENPPELFSSPTFEAYAEILRDPEKIRFFLNSYLVAVSVTLLTVLVAVLAAFAFSRYEFPGKRIINVVIISMQAVPPITLLIPFFGLMVKLKLYNTYPGLILTYMVLTLPYAIIMLTGYFNTLPRELDEAANMDGASSFGALWRILVPVSIPGVSIRPDVDQDEQYEDGSDRNSTADGPAFL